MVRGETVGSGEGLQGQGRDCGVRRENVGSEERLWGQERGR